MVDNYQFSYKPYSHQYRDFGSITISDTGNSIILIIKEEAKSFDFILKKLCQIYDTTEDEIKDDVLEFLEELISKGFICSGNTISECLDNDFKFTYYVKLDKKLNDTIQFNESAILTDDILTSLHLEISSSCNERCIHCFIPPEFKNDIMGLELFEDIIKQAAKINVLHITLSGGEPMVNPHFIQFLKLCRENDFSVNVLSNLLLLSDEMIYEMKQNPLLSVQTSLYAISNEIHDSITGIKGSCEITKSALLKLIENNIPVQISCPVMKSNKDEFIKVLKWATSYNVTVITEFALIAEFNHKKENLKNRLSISEINALLNAINSYDKEYFKSLKVQTCETTQSNYRICSVLHENIGVLPNGDVFPCPGWENFKLGNIKTDGLMGIWNDSEKTKLLRSLTRKQFSKCNHCKDKMFCSPCLLRNANESENGDFMEMQT